MTNIHRCFPPVATPAVPPAPESGLVTGQRNMVIVKKTKKQNTTTGKQKNYVYSMYINSHR